MPMGAIKSAAQAHGSRLQVEKPNRRRKESCPLMLANMATPYPRGKCVERTLLARSRASTPVARSGGFWHGVLRCRRAGARRHRPKHPPGMVDRYEKCNHSEKEREGCNL
jgi:hypothetical protein